MVGKRCHRSLRWLPTLQDLQHIKTNTPSYVLCDIDRMSRRQSSSFSRTRSRLKASRQCGYLESDLWTPGWKRLSSRSGLRRIGSNASSKSTATTNTVATHKLLMMESFFGATVRSLAGERPRHQQNVRQNCRQSSILEHFIDHLNSFRLICDNGRKRRRVSSYTDALKLLQPCAAGSTKKEKKEMGLICFQCD